MRTMRRDETNRRAMGRVGLVAAVLLPLCAGAPLAATADDDAPFNAADLRVDLGPSATSFRYHFTYDVQGTVTHAQIQVGLQGSPGFSIWLCGTPANPGPPGTPKCPGLRSGEVKGTVSAERVVGPTGQTVAPEEFGEVLKAMRAGAGVANLHTTKHPSGEIQGQLK